MDEKYIETASNILINNLKVKSQERVLFVTDEVCEVFAQAFFEACQTMKMDGVIVKMPLTRTDGAEPSPKVAQAMENADVIVALTKYTLTHGKATKKALERGCRVLSIPNLTEKIFLSKAMEGAPGMISTTERISELLSSASSLSLATSRGTDIRCDLGGWSRVGGADTGEIDHPGILANLPAGESIVSPVEGTVWGKAIIDASISGGIGKIKEDVILDIEQGRIVSIKGGAEASALSKVLDGSDKNATHIAELAFGINPFAEVIGNIIIDEKTAGTAHIGIGNSEMLGGSIYSNVHVDAVFYGPRVEVDGHLIMADGHFYTGPAPWESIDFQGYDPAEAGTFEVRGSYEINPEGLLFKTWKDVMGRTFVTRVGDVEASRMGAIVVRSLKNGSADRQSLAKVCKLDDALTGRTIGMLNRYNLVEKIA